jgi:tetratricopeptide (TPR) repeat protein
MKRSSFILISCAVICALSLCGTARAQIGIIAGRVMFRQADGKVVPLQSATVDIFGLDTGAAFETKTDSEGGYISVGMEHNSIYLLAVSARDARPAVVLKRNSFDLNGDDIILEAGDGKRLTLALALAQVGPSKLKSMRALNAGEAALESDKYEDAIAKFDEGIAAEPDEPTLWIYKSKTYKMRGFKRHILSGRFLGNGVTSARQSEAGRDFRVAFETAKRAVELMKTLPVLTNPGTLARYKADMYGALEARARAGALLVDYADRSVTEEAFAAYQEYLHVESDWEKRAQAQIHAADILLRAYGNERVIDEYRKLNIAEPGNMDVIAILGLALYESGVESRYAESARYLRRFIPYGSDEDHPHPLWSKTRAALQSMRR